MVIVAEVSGSMIIPARDGVDDAGGIELTHNVGQLELGVVGSDLSPAFVVDNLG